MAIALAVLPLGILYVLLKLLPPWPEHEHELSESSTTAQVLKA
jgi:hypothetical protein